MSDTNCRHHDWAVDGRYWRCSQCGLRSLSAIPQHDWPAFGIVGKVTSIVQVGDGKPNESFVGVAGLKSAGPITIEGYWDDGSLVCWGCRKRFMVAKDQTYAQVRDAHGNVLGPACDDCAMAIVNDKDEL